MDEDLNSVVDKRYEEGKMGRQAPRFIKVKKGRDYEGGFEEGRAPLWGNSSPLYPTELYVELGFEAWIHRNVARLLRPFSILAAWIYPFDTSIDIHKSNDLQDGEKKTLALYLSLPSGHITAISPKKQDNDNPYSLPWGPSSLAMSLFMFHGGM